MLRIGIVGAGPWGTAVLDRVVMNALARPEMKFSVFVVDPCEFGPGSHKTNQADFLLLNTVASQIDSFSAAHFNEAPLRGAMSFSRWVKAVEKVDAGANGFLPRATFGRYLRYVFQVLRDNAPKNLEIRTLSDTAVGASLTSRDQVKLELARSDPLFVDHLFICTGHGIGSRDRIEKLAGLGRSELIDPYPATSLNDAIPNESTIGIVGCGLAAVDVVATLTEGRGGRFVEDDEGLRYCPSGREPTMFVYSRTGIPFSCRPSVSLDLFAAYQPIFCTEQYIQDRRRRRPAGLCLESDVLPAIFAEMRAAYLMRKLALSEGAGAATECRTSLSKLLLDDVEEYCTQRSPEAALFRPESLLLPTISSSKDSVEFVDFFRRQLAFDVQEAQKGEAESPYKYAVEMLRILRGFIRQVVDFDSLTPISRQMFFNKVAPRISQLVVGPPVARGRQWLALMRAGLLRVDLGPSPVIARDFSRGIWRVESTCFDSKFATCLSFLVRGYIQGGSFALGSDVLLSSLYQSGVCSAKAGGADGGLVPRITQCGSLIDAVGVPVPNMTLLGVPTEGATYFNHYLPSPKSRSAAFERIQTALALLINKSSVKEGNEVGVAA